MGIRVDVLPLNVNTPGHGLLRITGWEGASEGLQYSLQSSQTHKFLQTGGHWSDVAHPFALGSPVAVEGGQGIEAMIGPDLINPLLEASGTANFRIEVSNPQDGSTGMTMLRINPAIVASANNGPVLDTSPPPPPLPVPTPPPAPPVPEVVAAPEPEPVIAPEPEPEPEPVIAPERLSPPPLPPKRGNAWLLPLLLALLLALVAAGGAWWWFKMREQPPVIDVPVPEQKAPEPEATAAAAAPCTLDSMKTQDELAFVQGCMQNPPDSAALLEVINQAKANAHCGVAQRLYAKRAQDGDIAIASAYAHEYDPKFLQPSECFKAPDNATAAYWYETILGFDQNNAEAKERFAELKP